MVPGELGGRAVVEKPAPTDTLADPPLVRHVTLHGHTSPCATCRVLVRQPFRAWQEGQVPRKMTSVSRMTKPCVVAGSRQEAWFEAHATSSVVPHCWQTRWWWSSPRRASKRAAPRPAGSVGPTRSRPGRPVSRRPPGPTPCRGAGRPSVRSHRHGGGRASSAARRARRSAGPCSGGRRFGCPSHCSSVGSPF